MKKLLFIGLFLFTSMTYANLKIDCNLSLEENGGQSINHGRTEGDIEYNDITTLYATPNFVARIKNEHGNTSIVVSKYDFSSGYNYLEVFSIQLKQDQKTIISKIGGAINNDYISLEGSCFLKEE